MTERRNLSVAIEARPRDEHDAELLENVHPPGWRNPEPARRYNLVVIGAGTAGLVTAAGAAMLGARVALIERGRMGGDCLNVGCVPSKALIASARAAAEPQRAAALGVEAGDRARVDFAAVMRRLRRLRARISHHDSAQRFRKLGVDVFLGDGRFSGPDTVEVEGARLRFRKAVIATGGRPFVPPIEGLDATGYLTNETVFDLAERPGRLLVLGGGPIGCELAQAFRRLGSQVTLVELEPRILPREDPDAAEIVAGALRQDGVDLRTGAKAVRFTGDGSDKTVHLETGEGPRQVAVDEVLVAIGRAPNVEGLGLERVGVEYDRRGVKVDDRLRTTNRRIFAAGDVGLRHQFTHTADAAARIVLQNALFLGRKRLSALTVPWCTYTDPELAGVGLDAGEAARRGVEIDTFEVAMTEVDRALLEGEDRGFVRIRTRRGTDRIVGATIVAAHAGEMISEVTLAMVAGAGLGAIGNTIHPYPTRAEALKKVADARNRSRLTPGVRRLLAGWLRWTR